MKSHWKIALPLVVATGCAMGDGDNRAGVSVRDSSGVTIAENTGVDVPLDAAVALVADLVPPDSALTAVPWGVAADPATGRVYIADWTGSRVTVFDRTGTYIHSFGGEGDGPGEFRTASAVSLDSDGRPAVWDAGRGLLSRWSTEGNFIEEQRAPVSYWGPGFALSDSTLLTVTSTTSSSDLTMEQRLIAHAPRGTTTLHEVPRELAMMELPCASMPAPKLLAPSVLWTSRGDTTHLLNGPEYRIDRLVGDSLVASFRRMVDPIHVTEEIAVEAIRSGPGPYRSFLQRCGVTARQLAAEIGHEEVVSAVLAIAVDPSGGLWVTRSVDGITPQYIDIFDSGGSYGGTLEAPGIPVGFLSESTFLSLRLEETGRTVVSIYELVPAASEGS